MRVDISRLSTLTDYSYDEHSGRRPLDCPCVTMFYICMAHCASTMSLLDPPPQLGHPVAIRSHPTISLHALRGAFNFAHASPSLSCAGKLSVGAAVTLSQLLHLVQAHDAGPPPSFPNALSLFGLLHEHLTHVAHEQVSLPRWGMATTNTSSLIIQTRCTHPHAS